MHLINSEQFPKPPDFYTVHSPVNVHVWLLRHDLFTSFFHIDVTKNVSVCCVCVLYACLTCGPVLWVSKWVGICVGGFAQKESNKLPFIIAAVASYSCCCHTWPMPHFKEWLSYIQSFQRPGQETFKMWLSQIQGKTSVNVSLYTLRVSSQTCLARDHIWCIMDQSVMPDFVSYSLVQTDTCPIKWVNTFVHIDSAAYYTFCRLHVSCIPNYFYFIHQFHSCKVWCDSKCGTFTSDLKQLRLDFFTLANVVDKSQDLFAPQGNLFCHNSSSALRGGTALHCHAFHLCSKWSKYLSIFCFYSFCFWIFFFQTMYMK